MTTQTRALTLAEVLLVLVVVSFLCLVLTPHHCGRSKPLAQKLACLNNTKQIGLAMTMYAMDQGGFPWQTAATNGETREAARTADAAFHFLTISNELVTPRILTCPADAKPRVSQFSEVGASNVSYFVGVDATTNTPAELLVGDRNLSGGLLRGKLTFFPTQNPQAAWTKQVHMQEGNIAFVDGSAQRLGTPQLRQLLSNHASPMVRLAIP